VTQLCKNGTTTISSLCVVSPVQRTLPQRMNSSFPSLPRVSEVEGSPWKFHLHMTFPHHERVFNAPAHSGNPQVTEVIL